MHGTPSADTLLHAGCVGAKSTAPVLLEAARNPNFPLFSHERESQPLWKPSHFHLP